MLLFLFREWLISLLALFISVMGITGCVLGLFFAGIPLNVSSYTSIIMVVGIIAENANGPPVLRVTTRNRRRGYGHPLYHSPAHPT